MNDDDKSTEIKVVTRADIPEDSQVVEITEEELAEYYAPVSRDEMPNFSNIIDRTMDLLEYMNNDEQYSNGGEWYKRKLEGEFKEPYMIPIIKYLVDGNPIDDLLQTLEMGAKIKCGEISYDDGFESLKKEKQEKYIPEHIRKMNEEYLAGRSVDEILDKKISRKARRKIERISKKATKGKKN